MIEHRLLLPVALSILLGSPSGSAKAPPQPVVIEVQICEAMELKFWFNVDAEMRWGTCQTPLKGVRINAGRAGDDSKWVETDEKGRARLGPIVFVGDPKFSIIFMWAPKRSLILQDLVVGNGPFQEGQNKLLVYTVPEPPSAETKTEGS